MTADTFLNSLATGIGYAVIIGAVFRVLVPPTGRWLLEAVEDATLRFRATSDRVAWIREGQPRRVCLDCGRPIVRKP